MIPTRQPTRISKVSEKLAIGCVTVIMACVCALLILGVIWFARVALG